MKHNSIILLLSLMLLAACQGKTSVDFSYSPTEPRAGESIRFTNLSDGGEEWSWTFGDASSSTSKNPSKVYKKPGVYTVTLMVDNKKWLKHSAQITVVDTIPSMTCVSDSIDSIGSVGMFREATLTAAIYNPYGYTLSYCWEVNRHNVLILSGDTASSSMKVLFRAANEREPIRLTITRNGEAIAIDTALRIVDMPAAAIVMRTAAGIQRQRVYGTYFEDAHASSVAGDAALLDAVDETTATVAGKTFTLADVSALTGETVLGFTIVDRKIYYRTAKHVAVCNIGGQYPETIDAVAATALMASRVENRLFWATADSVFTMRLIQSDNNKFTTTPLPVNAVPGISALAYDSDAK